jgi:succinyl-CoA synthetase beta subunit
MKLHEYQSKNIFSKYGIPIPKGRVAATAQEANKSQKSLGAALLLNHKCWSADAAKLAA